MFRRTLNVVLTSLSGRSGSWKAQKPCCFSEKQNIVGNLWIWLRLILGLEDVLLIQLIFSSSQVRPPTRIFADWSRTESVIFDALKGGRGGWKWQEQICGESWCSWNCYLSHQEMISRTKQPACGRCSAKCFALNYSVATFTCRDSKWDAHQPLHLPCFLIRFEM